MLFDPGDWKRGDTLYVKLKNDDRELFAVYLGPAGEATPRPDRTMFAVDDGESWKLVMAPCIEGVSVTFHCCGRGT